MRSRTTRRPLPVAIALLYVLLPLLPSSAAPPAFAAPPPASRDAVTPVGGCPVPASPRWETALTALAPHPRVVFTGSDAAVLRAAGSQPTNPVTARASRRFTREAKAILLQPAPAPGEPAAQVSRRSVSRVMLLGSAWLGTGETAYADRIRAEVAALVARPGWDSDRFLTTAEMATAVATGYSLTASRMTEAERGATRDALVRKALAPASCLWAGRSWMVQRTSNWGAVTNAGMATAALVVADGDPRLAAGVLGQALPRVNRALEQLADGGSAEGPMYAGYIGEYAAYLTASLTHSLGAVGAGAVRRVPHAARYAVAVTGPSGRPFNYADSNTRPASSLLDAWNARRGDPLSAWVTRQQGVAGTASPLHLLWQAGARVAPAAPTSLAGHFPGSGMVSLRSGWSRDATWVALRGGSNASSHAQLELGSFALEMLGTRFVSDYGLDDYTLPGYFQPDRRGGYFRCSTAAASTLARAGRNQPWDAVAPLDAPRRDAGGTWRTGADLTRALEARSARRSVALAPDRSVTVTDSVTTGDAARLRWAVHTEASVTLSEDGRTAYLTRGGRTVAASLSARTGGRFRTEKPPVTPGGFANTGFTQLLLDTATAGSPGAARARVSVRFTPLRAAPPGS